MQSTLSLQRRSSCSYHTNDIPGLAGWDVTKAFDLLSSLCHLDDQHAVLR